jgi:uncharacterized protein (TIGR03435 family)
MNRAANSPARFLTVFLLSLVAFAGVRAQSQTGSPSVSLSEKPIPAKSNSVADLPKFDVATIKATKDDDGNSMMRFTPDGISVHGVPLKMLLREAFGVEDDRILGEPNWVKTRYDIEAKVDAEDAPRLKDLKFEQRRGMMLPLLTERFNLKYHHESRELPMYALVVAKGGLKMKEAAADPPTKSDDTKSDDTKSDDAKSDGPPKPDSANPNAAPRLGRHSLMMNGRGHLESTGTTVTMLVHVLSSTLGRSVVDKTGLTGSYDYTLQWTPDDVGTPMGGDAGPGKGDVSPDAGGPTLFTALEEQLGLKLESTKTTVDVIVIDHIDLPSEN